MKSLAEDLQAAGLEQDQAEVYVHLLRAGPVKVGQLSQYFDSSRSTLYRLLDELAEQGYVTKSLERPTIYEAAQPEQLFEVSLESVDRTRQRLVNVREKVLSDLQRLDQRSPDDDRDHHWRKMEGTEKIYQALHEMAEKAETSLWSASNHEVTLSRYLPAVEEAWRIGFRRAKEDGVDVRLLFDLQDEPYTHVPEWIGEAKTFQLRNFSAKETVHFVLTDAAELLMWVRPAPLGTLGKKDDVAVRTNAPGSVFAHRMLFERLWQEGKPVDVGSHHEA